MSAAEARQRVLMMLVPSDFDDADQDEAMEQVCARLQAAYAEAGYPNARVYFEWTGIFVEGVPEAVKQRGFDLINASHFDGYPATD